MAGSYRGFGVRPEIEDPNFPLVRAWRDRRLAQGLLDQLGRHVVTSFDNFRGITTDGIVQPGLYSLASAGASMAHAVVAATEFISLLDGEQKKLALLPIDSGEARNWFNGLEMPYGVSLRNANRPQREAALALIRACVSERGYEQVWTAMQLNGVLGEIVGDTVMLNTWNYALAFFGRPSAEEPWGWQLQGHHVLVSVFIVGDQVVMTPHFIGAEPAIVDEGPLKGMAILQEEERRGLEMLCGLEADQKRIAVVSESMLEAGLPPGRVIRADQRIQSGAFKDNQVIPYEGLCAASMNSAQQHRLMELVEVYVSRMPAGHDRVRLAEIERHIDSTHFAWIGKSGNDDPFYYKIHSPVILIEFDHHSGVVLDNRQPEKFHVHTLVRTPNGGDYGRDLLRQHYEQHHRPRLHGQSQNVVHRHAHGTDHGHSR